MLLVQQVEGNVLQPILQGKSLNLHAAVVLLAVTAGGTLYGIAGAFLAVPVAAAGATRAALPVRAGRPDVGGRRDRRSGGPGGRAGGGRGARGGAADAARVDGAASGPAVVDVPGACGAVPEPRPDAPNPEQLEMADDPDAPLPGSEPGPRATADGAARDRT